MKHSGTLLEEHRRPGTDMGLALPWRALAAKCATCLCSSRPMGESACTFTSSRSIYAEAQAVQILTPNCSNFLTFPCSI